MYCRHKPIIAKPNTLQTDRQLFLVFHSKFTTWYTKMFVMKAVHFNMSIFYVTYKYLFYGSVL